MSKPYLEITYRKGKPFAAYLYLSRRPGDTVARSEPRGGLVVDWSDDGRAIGVEIPSPSAKSAEEAQAALVQLSVVGIDSIDLAPLAA